MAVDGEFVDIVFDLNQWRQQKPTSTSRATGNKNQRHKRTDGRMAPEPPGPLWPSGLPWAHVARLAPPGPMDFDKVLEDRKTIK